MAAHILGKGDRFEVIVEDERVMGAPGRPVVFLAARMFVDAAGNGTEKGIRCPRLPSPFRQKKGKELTYLSISRLPTLNGDAD